MDAVVPVLELAVGVVTRRGLDETIQSWSRRRKEHCPECGVDPEFEVTDRISDVMYGQIQSKHCSKCLFKWTCKVAEDPDW